MHSFVPSQKPKFTKELIQEKGQRYLLCLRAIEGRGAGVILTRVEIFEGSSVGWRPGPADLTRNHLRTPDAPVPRRR